MKSPCPTHTLIDALHAGLPARGTILERSYQRAADHLTGFWQWRIVDCGEVYAALDVEQAHPGESHGELLSIEPLNLEIRYWRPAGTGMPDEREANIRYRDSLLGHKADSDEPALTHQEARALVRAETPGEWSEWCAAELSYGVLFSHVRVVSSAIASGDPSERGDLDVEPLPPIAHPAK